MTPTVFPVRAEPVKACPEPVEGGLYQASKKSPSTSSGRAVQISADPDKNPEAHAEEHFETHAQALSPSALLQLIWLASPALPVGGFSYSEGLEMAVACAGIDNESAAADWLADQLHLSLARSDLPVMAQAITAWRHSDLAQIEKLNNWILHTRESSEFRQQTEQMGRSLLEWLRHHEGANLSNIEALKSMAPTYPLAFALAASQTQATARDCLLAYAFGWAENMVQAAIKSVPLGQTSGQRILARLARDIPGAIEAALALTDDQRQAFSPMLAILSAQHEIQYSRLFRS
jgi:urease accessory protein